MINEVLDSGVSEQMGEFYSEISTVKDEGRRVKRRRTSVMYTNEDDTARSEIMQDGEVIDSPNQSLNKGVEPGMASSTLNTNSILDVADHERNSAHDTSAVPSRAGSLTIGTILIGALIMYEITRIF
jgi:hypothetical protein